MEAASQGLAKKFEAARKLFERALVNNLETPSMWELQNSLDALETRFALSTSHLYIKLMRQESERMMAQSEFARILASEDFAGEVDRLVLRAEAALRRGGLALRGEEGGSVLQRLHLVVQRVHRRANPHPPCDLGPVGKHKQRLRNLLSVAHFPSLASSRVFRAAATSRNV